MTHPLSATTLQVFEHEKLSVGDRRGGVTFTEQHWQALQQYHAQHPALPYYTVTHRGIQLRSYVGVLAVSGLILEVLPKTDLPETTPGVWRRWLVSMLQACQWLIPHHTAAVATQWDDQPLLDLWIRQFLEAVETLLRQGLHKRYVPVESLQPTVKGKILFAEHIRHHVTRQEKIFTRHQSYQERHLWHYALWQALDTVRTLPCCTSLQIQARAYQPFFPENALPGVAVHLGRFRPTRQTAHYTQALALARLLLQHRAPRLQAGTLPAWAFMVDMNRLFETYVYQQLQQAAAAQGATLARQVSAPFWQQRLLRPDMVLHTPQGLLVLDTKWKRLASQQPPEEDLKQMYVYNHYFQTRRSVLLYPQVNTKQVSYRAAFHQPSQDTRYCEVLFVPVLRHDHTLNRSLGSDILQQLQQLEK